MKPKRDAAQDKDEAWGAPDKPDFDSMTQHPESGTAGTKDKLVGPRDPAEWGSTSNSGREAWAKEIEKLATEQYGDYENN